MSDTQQPSIITDDGGSSIIELKDQLMFALTAEAAYFVGGIPDYTGAGWGVLRLMPTAGLEGDTLLAAQNNNKEFFNRVFGRNRPAHADDAVVDESFLGIGLTDTIETRDLEYVTKLMMDTYDVLEVREEVLDANGRPTGTGALILRNRYTNESVVVTDGTDDSPAKESFYIQDTQTGEWVSQPYVQNEDTGVWERAPVPDGIPAERLFFETDADYLANLIIIGGDEWNELEEFFVAERLEGLNANLRDENNERIKGTRKNGPAYDRLKARFYDVEAGEWDYDKLQFAAAEAYIAQRDGVRALVQDLIERGVIEQGTIISDSLGASIALDAGIIAADNEGIKGFNFVLLNAPGRGSYKNNYLLGSLFSSEQDQFLDLETRANINRVLRAIALGRDDSIDRVRGSLPTGSIIGIRRNGDIVGDTGIFLGTALTTLEPVAGTSASEVTNLLSSNHSNHFKGPQVISLLAIQREAEQMRARIRAKLKLTLVPPPYAEEERVKVLILGTYQGGGSEEVPVYAVPITLKDGSQVLVALGVTKMVEGIVDDRNTEVRDPRLNLKTPDGTWIALIAEEEISAFNYYMSIRDDPTITKKDRFENVIITASTYEDKVYSFCFVAGTPILMADGSEKPIELVRPGDLVASFDPTKSLNAAYVSKPVTKTFSNKNQETLRINDLQVTPAHKFYTKDSTFVAAGDLRIGSEIVDKNGKIVKVQTIEIAQKADVYNFTVADFHTYIAGGIRVHNDSPYGDYHFGDHEALVRFEDEQGNIGFFGRDSFGRDFTVTNVLNDNGTPNDSADDYLDSTYAYFSSVHAGLVILQTGEVAIGGDGFLDRDQVKTEIHFGKEVFHGDNIGHIFGSHIGRAISVDNAVSKILAGSLMTTLTSSIFGSINRFARLQPFDQAQGNASDFQGVALSRSMEGAFENFEERLGVEIKDTTRGAISSFLAAELIGNLGVDGHAAAILQGTSGAAINKILENIEAGKDVGAFDGIGDVNYSAVVASYIGGQLANSIYSPQTITGHIGGVLGSPIGVYVSTQVFGSAGAGTTLGQKAGVWAGPIGVFIGALVGTFFGSLLGDLFGSKPKGTADIKYDAARGKFIVGRVSTRNKAPKDALTAIAGQVAAGINGVVDFVGGEVINPHALELGTYTFYKRSFGYSTGLSVKRSEKFDDLDNLVTFGTLHALEDIKILGGDIYLKRALTNSIKNQGTTRSTVSGVDSLIHKTESEVQVLLGDLAVARDFSNFQKNPEVLNLLSVVAPDSALMAGWTITLVRAYELGLHRRAESDWYGGWDFILGADGALASTYEVSYSADSSERLISYKSGSGDLRTLRDTVNDADKDIIKATSLSDYIVVTGMNIEHASRYSIFNGSEFVTIKDDTYAIDVAAEIHAGAGDDTVYGGDRGNDIFGGTGNDNLYGGGTADWLFGEEGNDILDAYVDDDGNYLDGGAGNDTLIGRAGSDWLQGGAGTDIVDGGSGDDILEGGQGDNDIIRGGYGNDIYIFRQGDGSDRISDLGFEQGAKSTSVISSIATPNEGITGGDDTLAFGEGITLSTIRIRRDEDGAGVADDLLVEVILSDGTLTGDAIRLEDWFDPRNRIEWFEFADGQRIRISNFASFQVGGDGDEILISSNGNNFIHGGSGNDIMHLLGGDDVGNGGLGNDFITGDAGNDLVIGGNDDDRVLGGAGADIVSGDAGNDEVRGDAGDDILSGGVGNDTVIGGAGNDTFRFNRGDGFDTIFDAYSDDGWEVILNHNDGWVAGISILEDVDHDNDPTTNSVDQITFNDSVIYDGKNWLGVYRFDTSTNILERHRTEAVRNFGDSDTLEFAIGIDIDDLVFQADGDDLIVSIGGPFDDETVINSLADRIRLRDWNSVGQTIEQFSFYSTGVMDVTQFTSMYGGTDGDDIINGSNQKEWITGGVGDDTIDGAGGDDLLVGHGGRDMLIGGLGDDILLGGSGDDILIGGVGSDLLVGGEGFDVVSYRDADEGVVVGLVNEAIAATKIVHDTFIPHDTFISIEGLEGSAHGDHLVGNDQGNLIIGLAGDDLLEGGTGDDVYEFAGGHGNDIIRDRGIDDSGTIVQTARNEAGGITSAFVENFEPVGTDSPFNFIHHFYSWTVVHIASGDIAYEQQISTPSARTKPPEVFDDRLWKNGFKRTNNGMEIARVIPSVVYTDGGDDTILLSDVNTFSDLSFAFGDNGDLTITTPGGSITIEGFSSAEGVVEYLELADGTLVELDTLLRDSTDRAGNDFILAEENAGVVNGGDGNDTIIGAWGENILHGGKGDDVFVGREAADTFDGGEGSDTVRFVGSSAGVNVNLATGVSTGGDAAGDNFVSIENIIGSDHADAITGDLYSNELHGYEGNDTLYGGAGDDTLIGNEGNDVLHGGAGHDYLYGNEGFDTLYGGAGEDNLFGNTGDDLLFGDAGADFLSGGDGNDELLGGIGDDTLSGGAGDDTLRGGAGDEIYVVSFDEGNDVISDGEGLNTIAIEDAAETLRLDRDGQDLIVSSLTRDGSMRIQGYFSGASQIHSIAAADSILYLAHAAPLIDLFANVPRSATELPEEITEVFSRYWHLFGNARPEGTDQDHQISEDGIVADSISAIDHDDNISGYSLIGSPSNGSVVLNEQTGAYTYTPDANFNGQDFFYVDIIDENDNRTDVLVTIDVTPVNDAPTEVTFAGISSIDENAVGSSFGFLTVLDVDNADGSHVLSVDDSRFEIVKGELRLRNTLSFDFETDDVVTVSVTAIDTEGLSSPALELNFTINDVNEALSGVVQTFSITENARVGTSVGSISVVDPDTGIFAEMRYTFLHDDGAMSLTSQNGLFEIDSLSGEISTLGSFDFETNNTHQLMVLVRDNAGLAGHTQATIDAMVSVADVNEVATGISLSATAIDENANGFVVGTLTITDPDVVGTASFRTHDLSVDDDRFHVDAFGQLSLLPGAFIDFEAEETINLTVTATDISGAGLVYSEQFTLTVNDLIDVIEGTSAAEALSGAQGVDHLFGYGGHDVLEGQAGDDRLYGGTGDDTLYGGAGDDALAGGAGNDTLTGGSGADQLVGGAGIDTASYKNAATSVTVDLGDLSNNTGDASGDNFSSIETIAGSVFDDIFIGTDTDDHFIGNDGDDTLTGNAGNDTLSGGAGDDIIISGSGDDILIGGIGNDTLDAGGGKDRLDGGAGNDILIGGAGSDIYVVTRDSGADIIQNYDPSGAGDTISFADDITYEDLWFSRSGDDLLISVIGSGASVLITDWYLTPEIGQPDNTFMVELFQAGAREALDVNAENLVDVMSAYAVPATIEERDVAFSVISGTVDSMWDFSTPPEISEIADLTVLEDGTITFSMQITDDKVANELLNVEVVTDNNSLVSPANVLIGAPDVDGWRTISITPNTHASGVVAISLQATDGGSVAATRELQLTVSAQADAPALAVSDVAGNEGKPIALAINADLVDTSEDLSIEISGIPVDASLNNGTYDASRMTWVLSTSDLVGLTLTAPVNGQGTDLSLEVRAISTDGTDRAEKIEVLNVNINAAPTDVSLSQDVGGVAENAANGTVVGSVLADDPDGDRLVYSLIDNSSGRFAINASTGEIVVNNSNLMDYEQSVSHDIQVSVFDGSLLTNRTLTINVQDVNEQVHIENFSATIDENIEGDSAVRKFFDASTFAIDPDGGEFGRLRYYFANADGPINAGNESEDGNLWIDASTGEITNLGGFNFEHLSQHTYTVLVRDIWGQEGYTESKATFTLNVRNVNEAPTSIREISNLSVNENAASGTYVGQVEAIDVDSSHTPQGLIYSLTEGGDRFAIDAATGVLSVVNGKLLDHESSPDSRITVRVTDSGGISYSEAFDVSVENVNEKPYWTDFFSSELSTESSPNVIHLAENKANKNADVAYLKGADPDDETPSFYFRHSNGSLSTVSQDGRFGITQNSTIEVNQSNLDYETTPDELSYNLAVKDSGGLSQNLPITIRITDVNEAPNISDHTFNVVESWNPQHAVDQVTVYDADLSTLANGQHIFVITGGNTNNRFRIDNQGRIFINGVLDYENTSERNFNLTVAVRDRSGASGYHQDTANVAINVQNVDDVPVVSSISEDTRNVWIKNDIVNDRYVYMKYSDAIISAYDPEGQNLTYSIIGGSGDWQDARLAGKGRISFAGVGDRSASVQVRISDGTTNVTRTVSISQDTLILLAENWRPELSLNGDGFELTYALDDTELAHVTSAYSNTTSVGTPIMIDLDHDGLELIRASISGVLNGVAWVGADDGLLVLDRNGDGDIDNISEISFIGDVAGATTDLEGLTGFDSNFDGVLDAQDARFSEFQVWQDVNSNGVSEAGELYSLTDLGVVSIDLTPHGIGFSIDGADDNVIADTTTYTDVEGAQHTVFDTDFIYDEDALAEDNAQDGQAEASTVQSLFDQLQPAMSSSDSPDTMADEKMQTPSTTDLEVDKLIQAMATFSADDTHEGELVKHDTGVMSGMELSTPL